MLVVLSSPRSPGIGGFSRGTPWLAAHRDRAVRPRRALLAGDQAPVRSGVLPDRGRVGPARVGGLAARRPEGSPRRTPLDGPVALIVAAALCSIAVNFGRVAPLAGGSSQGLHALLLLHYLLLFHRERRHDRFRRVAVTKFIVSGVAVVAASAIVEQRTGFNVFDHVRTVFRSCNSKVRSCTSTVRTHPRDRVCGSSDRARCSLGDVPPARFRTRTIGIDPVVGPYVVTLMGILATASRTPILARSPPPLSCSCGFARVTFVRLCLS